MSVARCRAAVLGSPVAHSLSPVLHRAGYAAAGLDRWTYERIECGAGELPALVRGSGPQWAGYSVTMPGKAAAAAVADHRSPVVDLLGVANTLWRGAPSGVPSRTAKAAGPGWSEPGWNAENTDVDGVVGALQAAGVAPVRVLLLGGGGTALSVVAALARMGALEVVLAGRRPQSTSSGLRIAHRLGLAAAAVEFSASGINPHLNRVDLVVSTVPAGIADPFAAALASVPALFDVVYAPWPTALAAASEPGRVTVTGLDLLLHQAFRQFELFTGVPAPRAAMRDGLLAATGAELPLPLG